MIYVILPESIHAMHVALICRVVSKFARLHSLTHHGELTKRTEDDNQTASLCGDRRARRWLHFFLLVKVLWKWILQFASYYVVAVIVINFAICASEFARLDTRSSCIRWATIFAKNNKQISKPEVVDEEEVEVVEDVAVGDDWGAVLFVVVAEVGESFSLLLFDRFFFFCALALAFVFDEFSSSMSSYSSSSNLCRATTTRFKFQSWR